jgi:Tol biopolymer transport system component
VIGLALVAGGCLHEDDDRKILFTSDRDGDYALYAMEEDGGGQTRVMQVAAGSPARPPLVSPDGRRVLLFADGVWAADLGDGERVRLVRGDPYEVYDAAWSPDSERVAYSTAHGLVVADRDGGGRVRLSRRGGDGSPAWSADGRRIAYAAQDGVWVVGADGRGRMHLTRHFSESAPAWEPGGGRIAFVGGDIDAASNDLYVLAIGGAPRSLARGAAGTPTWSPDGAELAYFVAPTRFEAEFDHGVAVVDPRNGRRIRFIHDVEEPPVWSPDGQRVLFATLGSSEPAPNELAQVLIMRRDGSGARRLTGAYPHGGSNRPIGWITGDHATEPSPSAVVEPLPKGASVLRVPHPVGVVSAERDEVAIAPPPLEFETRRSLPPLLRWSPATGEVARRAVAGCRGLGWPTLSGGRIVFDCNNSYVDTISHSVRVFDPASMRPREVLVGRNTPGLLHSGVRVESIAGRGGLVAIGTERILQSERVHRTVWRLVGDRPHPVRQGLGVGLVVAADDSRIALQVGARRLAIARPDGTVTATIELATPAPELTYFVYGGETSVAFADSQLLVARDGRLDVYDTRSGRRQRSRPLGRGSRSVSAAGGLVSYVRGRAIRVRRLSDDREIRIRVGGALARGAFRGLYVGRWIHANLAAAGLFYSYNLRAGPTPGRVVFIPREELERRLDSV